jgi:hypothetical protein
MWIKLNFTPLFTGALVIGLLVVGAGLILRFSVPKLATLGIVVAVIGAIPTLLSALFLISEPIGDYFNKRNNQTRYEVLEKDREIEGLHLPQGTKVGWLGRPRMMETVTLAQPQQVLGLPLEGTLKFANWSAGRADNPVTAALETATLAADHVIDGVPCKAHTEVQIDRARIPDPPEGQIPNASVGKLARCTASAPFEFLGHRYAGNYEVTFNGAGDLEKGLLAEDQEIDGRLSKGGTPIERPWKTATRFTLVREETIGGIACHSDTEVVLEPQQFKMISAVLARDEEIGGMPCKKGEAVGFTYREGEYPLDSCVISRPVTRMEVMWPAGSRLDGLVMGGGLAVTLPAGSAGVTMGEIKIVGRCRINMTKSPRALNGVEALDSDAYISFRNGRFADFNIYKDEGYGHLRDAGHVEGVPYQAGDLVRWSMGFPK